MGIDEIKRWQWVVVGLIVGLCLGFAWTSGGNEPEGRMRGQVDFERALLRVHPKTGEPLVRAIVVHPVQPDFQNKPVQIITYDCLLEGATSHKTYYQPQKFVAPVPYKPIMGGMAQTPLPANATIADFLKAVSASNRPNAANVSYRCGWESVKPIAITMWALISAAIIGGVWPTVINLMTGAGLGIRREKKPREEDYFARFSHAPEPSRPAEPASAVSDAERQRLDEMNRRLEAQLQAAGVITDPTAPPEEDPEGKILAPQEVRKLEAGPLELAPAAKKADEDDQVEVKGEYYPVLIHHKKHADNAEKHAEDAKE